MVDAEHVVHHCSCPDVSDPALPYTACPDNMQAWLARLDVRDSHTGPAVIRACPCCVPEVPDDRDL